MKQRKRKVKCNVEEPILFIPNIWLPISISASHDVEHSLRSAFCSKDKIQWFFLVKKQYGFSDFEKISCGCCGGDLWRDEGFDSGFSASDTPEVVGWLQEHPSKSKTLMLAFLPSCLEQARNVLQSHLMKHDFTASFKKLLIVEAGKPFLKRSKRQGKRKNSLSYTLLSCKEIKKPRRKSADKGIVISTILRAASITEKERTKVNRLNRLQKQKFSASAKKILKAWQENSVSQNSFDKYRIFKEKQELLDSQSPMLNLKDAWKDLRKLSKCTARKRASVVRHLTSEHLHPLPTEKGSYRPNSPKKKRKKEKVNGAKFKRNMALTLLRRV